MILAGRMLAWHVVHLPRKLRSLLESAEVTQGGLRVASVDNSSRSGRKSAPELEDHISAFPSAVGSRVSLPCLLGPRVTRWTRGGPARL